MTDDEQRADVEQAMARTRQFIDEQLLPELALSEQRAAFKTAQLQRYVQLHDHVRLHSDSDGSSRALVAFSNGLHVEAEVDAGAPYLVCMPVAEVLGEPPALFVELTPDETAAFVDRLRPLLERSAAASQLKAQQVARKHRKMLNLLDQLQQTI